MALKNIALPAKVLLNSIHFTPVNNPMSVLSNICFNSANSPRSLFKKLIFRPLCF